MSNIAFVLGNGTSRELINPNKLRSIGKIYGCNALYRTFAPDHLVAVDAKMVREIAGSGYQNKHSVWTNENKNYKNIPNLNYFRPSKGWSSGPTALWLASRHCYKTIYILGFDYTGLNDGATVNNIYADTPNYKSSRATATYHGNWLKQTRQTIKENPEIKYVRVTEPRGFIPKELVNIKNIKHIKMDEFMQIFPSLYDDQ
jgi:hypothetical protein